jgi:hypothetical protein
MALPLMPLLKAKQLVGSMLSLSWDDLHVEFLSMLPSSIYLIAKGFHPQAKLYFDTPFFKFVAVFLGVGVIAVVMIRD